MKIPALLATLTLAAAALTLTACDNSNCQAAALTNYQLTSVTTKGGGGGGGGHASGGGGHAGGESGGESAGHSSESDTTSNGTATIPHGTGNAGSGSDCKKQQ
jgi:uncharacterized membrane protein YgcG